MKGGGVVGRREVGGVVLVGGMKVGGVVGRREVGGVGQLARQPAAVGRLCSQENPGGGKWEMRASDN